MERSPGEAANRLSKAAVARIAGITPGHYGDLVAKEVPGIEPASVLPPIAEAGCTLMDCIRLVVLASLITDLKRDAVAAYCRVRNHLPDVLFQDDLDVVYDKQTGTCHLCTSIADLAEAVRMRRPVIVVPVGAVVRVARERYMEQAGQRRSAATGRRRRNSTTQRGRSI